MVKTTKEVGTIKSDDHKLKANMSKITCKKGLNLIINGQLRCSKVPFKDPSLLYVMCTVVI